ncbi:hypothetical protein AAFF_G00004740 [Aldrovandia affinis]|uniref:Uncharacterized protein n=1 Tax=Aldrovandia affinis TaxID=143900 RepID=A0AAD7TDP4_9TELE|nr:hypothetical protein AAFF_G00004740 [Aldrovandia affinis]
MNATGRTPDFDERYRFKKREKRTHFLRGSMFTEQEEASAHILEQLTRFPARIDTAARNNSTMLAPATPTPVKPEDEKQDLPFGQRSRH